MPGGFSQQDDSWDTAAALVGSNAIDSRGCGATAILGSLLDSQKAPARDPMRWIPGGGLPLPPDSLFGKLLSSAKSN